MQERHNSIANTLELHLSCTKPSILRISCEIALMWHLALLGHQWVKFPVISSVKSAKSARLIVADKWAAVIKSRLQWLLPTLGTANCNRSLVIIGSQYGTWNTNFNMYSLYMLRLFHFDGLVQERRNSSVLVMKLCLSCTNPSNCSR